ncbi:MAG TPA: hypothetical protein VMS64_26950 [Candidatus Methylomirabilis sp.]|nr:hypothetical protein [Candidatus Methylomirabilis sp.]
MSKPTVVIHTSDAQLVSARVGAHSLKSRSKSPDLFDVRLLRLEGTPHLYKRHNQRFFWWGDAPSVWRRRDSLAFAPLRRMVPALLGFQGRALLLDPDIFAIGDVYELLTRDMHGKRIFCRQKSEWRDGRQLYSSAVMLLECSRLTHWQWERDIDEIFRGTIKLGPWLSLLDEPTEHIGLLEDEWNHCDTLTEQTKLLHNTEIHTQPWKTGLPADYHDHAPRWPAPVERCRRLARRMLSADGGRPIVYRPHPDQRQERLFFSLLKECLDAGGITRRFLRQAMRRNHLRKDALTLLDGVPDRSLRSCLESPSTPWR